MFFFSDIFKDLNISIYLNCFISLYSLFWGRRDLYFPSGPLLAIAAAFGILTGGVTIYNILQTRLQATSHETTPAWCAQLLQATCPDAQLLWGKTQGNPRNKKGNALEVDHEQLRLPPPDQAPGPATSAGEEATEGAACGRLTRRLRLLGSLGLEALCYSRLSATETVAVVPATVVGVPSTPSAIFEQSRGVWMTPMPLFLSHGLRTKILCDRTMELWTDARLDTAQTFLRQYAILLLLGTPRMPSILQRRSAILGSDLLPVRYPPQLLLHDNRELQKMVTKLSATMQRGSIVLDWCKIENVCCYVMKICDKLNGVPTHAGY